jgi:hypothetical protein
MTVFVILGNLTESDSSESSFAQPWLDADLPFASFEAGPEQLLFEVSALAWTWEFKPLECPLSQLIGADCVTCAAWFALISMVSELSLLPTVFTASSSFITTSPIAHLHSMCLIHAYLL